MKRNDALLAKIRGMLGKRLLPADYARLMALPGVDAVAKALADHPSCAGIAQQLREGTLHRLYIESLLRREYYDEFAALYQYLSRGERELTRPVVWKYEIEEILLCLHANRGQTAFIRFHNDLMDPFGCVDSGKLAGVSGAEELLQALEGTRYAELLSPLLRGGRIAYVEAENVLYLDFFKRCVRLIREKAEKESRRELEEAIGLHIDCQNLARVIRLRRYFDLPPQEIAPYLITPYYKLDEKILYAIASSPEEAWGEILGGTIYTPPRNGHPNWSENLDELIWERARKTVRLTRYAPTAVLAYLRLKDTELKNIITLIESKRYGLDNGSAFSHLIGIGGGKEAG